MASDTVIASSEQRARGGLLSMLGLRGSRVGRTILALNLLGLLIIVAGALVFNELRQGLIRGQLDNLQTQGQVLADILKSRATAGEPEPVLFADTARELLRVIFPRNAAQRARVFDAQGALIADSFFEADTIESHPLPNLRRPGGVFRLDLRAHDPKATPRENAAGRKALAAEVRAALEGQIQAHTRIGENGHQVTSVSIPIQHVRAVTGVLTLEAGDVDGIILKQRLALVPFILIALLVTLASSLALNRLIADPVRRLASAADKVRQSRARTISLPDLARRNDELGRLGRSLESMTDAQSERMDAIERFAADVTHEIRNPLTSIRSAVETLELVEDPAAKDRLTHILKQDVARLDRLITDISNASRLDAELSRDAPRTVDLGQLVADITALYAASVKVGEPLVSLSADPGPLLVHGREGPLSQVFRNLIDNARSFTVLAGRTSPEVRVSLRQAGGRIVATVDDDGPGIPPENLETVFERFYTSRRKAPGAGGGMGVGNSGLGLSIVRQIATAHNGQVWAENRMDNTGAVLGARFMVSLPELKPSL